MYSYGKWRFAFTLQLAFHSGSFEFASTYEFPLKLMNKQLYRYANSYSNDHKFTLNSKLLLLFAAKKLPIESLSSSKQLKHFQ